jgi:hypothetical protein
MPILASSPRAVIRRPTTAYELFYACKPHDCADNAMGLMFAPHGAKAWGAMVEDGKAVSFLGAPNAAQQAVFKEAFQK